MLLATVYFSSLIFFVIEHKVNPQVTGYDDALWWAFMDVTTVGSNIYAVTPTGRILSVLLAALGMMMFPIFTVYVTSLVQNANKRKNELYNEDNTPQPEAANRRHRNLRKGKNNIVGNKLFRSLTFYTKKTGMDLLKENPCL